MRGLMQICKRSGLVRYVLGVCGRLDLHTKQIEKAEWDIFWSGPSRFETWAFSGYWSLSCLGGIACGRWKNSVPASTCPSHIFPPHPGQRAFQRLSSSETPRVQAGCFATGTLGIPGSRYAHRHQPLGTHRTLNQQP